MTTMHIRTAVEGPNKRGKYRAVMVVDGKKAEQTPWMSEAAAMKRLDRVREALVELAAKNDCTLTFNQPSPPG